jgi:hypothetical protein
MKKAMGRRAAVLAASGAATLLVAFGPAVTAAQACWDDGHDGHRTSWDRKDGWDGKGRGWDGKGRGWDGKGRGWDGRRGWDGWDGWDGRRGWDGWNGGRGWDG